ncbi:MAG: hypothetical protein QXS54_06070 [Candidatus Methanomethylicaceae archaeon]
MRAQNLNLLTESLDFSPKGISELKSNGSTLVAWNFRSHLSADRSTYSFATHDGTEWRGYVLQSPQTRRVIEPETLVIGPDDTVWLTTRNEILVVDLKANTAQAFPVSPSLSRSFYVYSAGPHACIARTDGMKSFLLWRQENTLQKHLLSKDAILVGANYDKEENCWYVYLSDHRLYRYSPQDQSFSQVASLPYDTHYVPPFLYRASADTLYYKLDSDKGSQQDWHTVSLKAVRSHLASHSAIMGIAGDRDNLFVLLHSYIPNQGAIAYFRGDKLVEVLSSPSWIPGIIHHKGYLCIASNIQGSITFKDRSDVPRNNGFLLYDPKTQTFANAFPSKEQFHAPSMAVASKYQSMPTLSY